MPRAGVSLDRANRARDDAWVDRASWTEEDAWEDPVGHPAPAGRLYDVEAASDGLPYDGDAGRSPDGTIYDAGPVGGLYDVDADLQALASPDGDPSPRRSRSRLREAPSGRAGWHENYATVEPDAWSEAAAWAEARSRARARRHGEDRSQPSPGRPSRRRLDRDEPEGRPNLRLAPEPSAPPARRPPREAPIRRPEAEVPVRRGTADSPSRRAPSDTPERRVPSGGSERRVTSDPSPYRALSEIPEREAPSEQPARRTITIQGRGAERYATARRRPQRPVHERSGFRPDRAAMWAVFLGLLLMLAAATSSHAATLSAHALAHIR